MFQIGNSPESPVRQGGQRLLTGTSVDFGILEARPEIGAARSADVTRSQRVGIN
jgi:hypothetical protein